MGSSKRRAIKNSHLFGWLRAVGFGSIAIGSLGLIQSFFWPSVVLFYAGLLVLVIDLWLEALLLRWKFTAWAVIVIVAMAFLIAVVLRKSPLQIDYAITDTREVDLVIHNASADDDYRDIDLTFGTDSETARFYDLRNLSDFPRVTAVDPDWRLRSKDETLTVYDDPIQKRFVVLQKQLRIRCPLLPKQSSAHVLLTLVASGKSGPRTPATDWHRLTAKGGFAGRFRNVDVSIALPRD